MSAPKRPATDEALEGEPASKRVCVASLDPSDTAVSDEKKEKWYHTNHAICTVKVHVGDKWCLHLTEQQWWDTKSEYLREYPTTKTVDLPPATFNDWDDLVAVFDWIIPNYYASDSRTIKPHDLARHIKLMGFLGCADSDIRKRLTMLEEGCADNKVSYSDLAEWAGVFKSKVLWKKAAKRCLCDNGTTLPDQPPPELTQAMVEWYRENPNAKDETTIERIKVICQTYLNSHVNAQRVIERYAPSTFIDNNEEHYERFALPSLNSICAILGVYYK